MERDCDYYKDRASISKDDKIWIGPQYQGKPVPAGLYCGYEILTFSEDEGYVQFRLIDGGNTTYNLPEGLFHLEYRSNFRNEYLGEKRCHDPSLTTWNELSRDEILENRRESSSDDWTYQELDDFLSNSQILKAIAKPIFKSIFESLSQRWNQLIYRLDMRLNRDILSTQRSAPQ